MKRMKRVLSLILAIVIAFAGMNFSGWSATVWAVEGELPTVGVYSSTEKSVENLITSINFYKGSKNAYVILDEGYALDERYTLEGEESPIGAIYAEVWNDDSPELVTGEALYASFEPVGESSSAYQIEFRDSFVDTAAEYDCYLKIHAKNTAEGYEDDRAEATVAICNRTVFEEGKFLFTAEGFSWENGTVESLDCATDALEMNYADRWISLEFLFAGDDNEPGEPIDIISDNSLTDGFTIRRGDESAIVAVNTDSEEADIIVRKQELEGGEILSYVYSFEVLVPATYTFSYFTDDKEQQSVTLNVIASGLGFYHNSDDHYMTLQDRYTGKGFSDTFSPESITFKPCDEELEYSVFVYTPLGYGSDGNASHRPVTASNKNEDWTDNVLFFSNQSITGDAFASEHEWDDVTNYGGTVATTHGDMTFTLTEIAHDDITFYIRYEVNGETQLFVYTWRISDESVTVNRPNEFSDSEWTRPEGFYGYIISKEEYENNGIDWKLPQPLASTGGSSMKDVIDKLSDAIKTRKAENRGYFYIEVNYEMDDSEAIKNAQKDQYLTSDIGGAADINGILLMGSAVEYATHISIATDIVEAVKAIEGSLLSDGIDENNKYLASIEWAVNVDDEDDIIYTFEPIQGDDVVWEETYFHVLDGNPEDGFTLTDANLYENKIHEAEGAPVDCAIFYNGNYYKTMGWLNVETNFPKLHVDATNEILVRGRFAEVPEGEANVFMNMAPGTITRINGESYTLKDDKSIVVSASDGTLLDPIKNGDIKPRNGTIDHWALGKIDYSYSVKVDKLDVESKTDLSDESMVCDASVDVDVNSLYDQIYGGLDQTKKTQVNDGKNISVALIVEDVEPTASMESSLKTVTDEMTYDSVEYLDINLNYQVGYTSDNKIEETRKPVEITLTLLGDGYSSDKGEYKIYRNHDGQAEILNATKVNVIDGGVQVTFETDRFSEYALLTDVADLEPAAKPEAPVLDSKTAGTITVNELTDDEKTYSYGIKEADAEEIEWQTSNIFEGLNPNTAYKLFVKVDRKTGAWAESEASDALEVTTDKISISGASVSLSANTFVYDGTDKNPTVTVRLDGEILESDNYSVSYGADATNVGTVTVTVTGSGDYTGSATANFTITKANQQNFAIAELDDVTYGDEDITLSTSGGNGDGAVTYSIPSNNGVATISGDTLTIVGAGTVVITATKAESANYKSTTATYTLSVEKKELTPAITGSIVKIYDGNVFVAGATTNTLAIALTGLVEADEADVSATAGRFVFASANVSDSATVNATGITLNGVKATNYTLSSTSASKVAGKINKATPTITLGNLSQKSNNIHAVSATLSPASDDATVTVEYRYLKTPAVAAVEGHACKYGEEGSYDHIASCPLAADEPEEGATCDCGFGDGHAAHNSSCGYVEAVLAQEAVYEWKSTVPTTVGSYEVRAYLTEANAGDNLNSVGTAADPATTGTLVITQYVAPTPQPEAKPETKPESETKTEVTPQPQTATQSETKPETTVAPEVNPVTPTVPVEETKVEVTEDKKNDKPAVQPQKAPASTPALEAVTEAEPVVVLETEELTIKVAESEEKTVVIATIDASSEEAWESIEDVITDSIEAANEAQATVEVRIELNETKEVPTTVIESIAGKNVDLTFELGEGISWTINGNDVAGVSFESIDLAVTKDAGEIPETLVAEVSGDNEIVTISLAHDGEFGFTATLTIAIDKKDAGKYANLYYYNETTDALEFMCSALISENGDADLTFVHASDYVIVVADEPVVVAENAENVENVAVNDGANITDSSANDSTAEIILSNKANNNMIWVIVVIVAAAIVILGAVVVFSKKKKA